MHVGAGPTTFLLLPATISQAIVSGDALQQVVISGSAGSDQATSIAPAPAAEATAFAAEPAVPARGGTQRYDLRPRPKPSARDAFLVMITYILLLPLAAG